MNLPQQPGRYIGKPVNYAVQPSDDPTKQTVAWSCLYDLVYFFDRATNQWIDVSQDGLQITGFHYVIKSDGQPNTTQIKQLQAALGWDGRALSTLEQDGFQGREVQLQVDAETYNGKTRLKVNWIDIRDADPAGGGGVKRAEPAVVQSLDAKYGPMLRALNGNAPAPATGKPAAPPHQSVGSATQAANEARGKAWKAYQAKNPGKSADELGDGWRATVKSVVGEKDAKTITAAEWAKIQQRIEKPEPEPAMAGGGGGVDPIGKEKMFDIDDIPFRTERRHDQPV